MHTHSRSSESGSGGPADAAVREELGSQQSDGDDSYGTAWDDASPRHSDVLKRFENDDPFEDLFWRWD